jgi:hypothetical protein
MKDRTGSLEVRGAERKNANVVNVSRNEIRDFHGGLSPLGFPD